MQQWWDDTDKEKPKYWKIKWPNTTLNTTNLTQIDGGDQKSEEKI
jgi:hypothetical protein